MALATDVVTGNLGTRIYLCVTIPDLPDHIIATGSNDSAVDTATEARRQAWNTFDNGTTNSFVEAQGFDTVPDTAFEFDMNEFTQVSNGLKLPFKGAVSAGETEINMAYKENDPGQIIFRKFGNSRAACSFRLDRPNGTRTYFVALVAGGGTTGGDANSVLQMSATVRLADFAVDIPASWTP